MFRYPSEACLLADEPAPTQTDLAPEREEEDGSEGDGDRPAAYPRLADTTPPAEPTAKPSSESRLQQYLAGLVMLFARVFGRIFRKASLITDVINIGLTEN